MPLKFDVTRVPPTNEAIKAELKHQKRKFWLFNLLGLVTSITFSYLLMFANLGGAVFEWDFALTMKAVQTHHKRIAEMAALFSSLIFAYNFIRFDVGKSDLTNLNLSRCEKALALSTEHPEINAYRLAVVKQRLLVNADLDAMERFPKEQEQRQAKDKLQHDFDKLHNPNYQNETKDETKL